MLMQFLRDRRAAVLPIFAIAAIPMIVATGAVIDYARAYAQRTVVQDALDAAALASGKKIGVVSDTLAKLEATNFYDANIGANKLDIKPAVAAEIAASTMTLTTQLHVPTYFLGLIGLNEFVFNMKAQSTQAAGTIEVALVLDNSGSMAGTKIATLITAATDLTNKLYALAATSASLNPVEMALIPFASSVNVDPANKSAAWIDQTGVAPYNGESFEGASGSPPVSTNLPAATNVLDLYNSLAGTGSAWAGCVEERKAPYDVQDDAASTSTPATMFVPMFAPDEPDNWTCTTGTSSCKKSCDSDPDGSSCTSGSAGLRYNGVPAAGSTQNYNNYLPDEGTAGTCGTLTISSATPAVFTETAHGLTAGTPVMFETTGTLYTGLAVNTLYYVTAAGLTTNTFDVTTTTTGTTFTSSGTPVTTTIAAPAVFTSTVTHGLAVGDQVKFGTTGSLPTGLTAGTSYYVKKVQSTTTFSVSAASANTTVTMTKASPAVFTTAAAHGLSAGNAIVFQTTGALYTGLTAGTIYYVLSTGLTTTSFRVSTTSGGTAVNTSGSQSGTQSFTKLVTTTGSQSGSHNFVKVGAPTVFTSTGHGLSVGNAIGVSSTGSLPSPLSASTVYYVVSVPNSNLFTLSTTSGGVGITTTSAGSGTLSFVKLVATTGSQTGIQRVTVPNNYTCANGVAGCGTGSVGKSEQTALLGQNSPQNLCKYGTAANKATITSINVDTSGGGTYSGGPNFNCTTKPIVPLTTTKTTITTAIAGMVANGTTNITSGLMWGWRVLSNGAPFTEGRAYLAANNRKYLILMTDGENTYFDDSKFPVSHYGAWGYIWKSHLGTTSSTESVMTGKMEERMALACTNVKKGADVNDPKDDISVFTIGFLIPAGSPTLTLLSNCATDPTMAFQSDSTAELTKAFGAIGDQISKLRLSE